MCERGRTETVLWMTAARRTPEEPGVEGRPRADDLVGEREEVMEVQPGTPSVKGPTEWFTGDVWLDRIAHGEEPSHVRVSAVHFTPGARTAWHSHALGQTVYVTQGEGRMQARDGEIVTIRAGDIVHTPADEEHWHGASPDHFMSHLSITEGGGESELVEIQWGAHVTDDEYGAS